MEMRDIKLKQEQQDAKLDSLAIGVEMMAESVKESAVSVKELSASVSKLLERDVRLQERERSQREHNSRVDAKLDAMAKEFYKIRDIVLQNTVKTNENYEFIKKYSGWIVCGVTLLIAYLRKHI